MDPNHGKAELVWNARRVQPVTVVYVVVVFAAFMAMAWFVFHSPDAVKALFAAAVGAVASLVTTVLSRVEYRLSDEGVAKRVHRAKSPREYELLFAWDELSHLVPTGAGFKFYRRLDEPGPLRRFLKLHVSGDHSGELHVEPRDRDRVRSLLVGRGVPISRRLPRGQEERP